MIESKLYTLNGPVQAGDGVYIERQADKDLLKACEDGLFAYVLAPRQIGKSSLMSATARKLEVDGTRAAIVDLTSIGSNVESADQWYFSFLQVIAQRLQLKASISGWWKEHAELSTSQRFIRFFRDIALHEIPGRIVVFVDEIDSTLSLPFSRDDFFAAVRAMHNARTEEPVFRRLSFVLIGTATPSELIADPTRTPFNIGQRIDLTDFTFGEAFHLASGLCMDAPKAQQETIARILHWTGGQPYLTQGLCQKISQKRFHDFDQANLDRIVEQTYLDEEGKQDDHFQFVRKMLTQRLSEPMSMLSMYREILQGRRVPDDPKSPIQVQLKLSGVVKAEKGLLRVRNLIYARVFDQRWVNEQLPSFKKWWRSLAPQRKATLFIVPGVLIIMVLCIATIVSSTWAIFTGNQVQQLQAQALQAEATRHFAETQAPQAQATRQAAEAQVQQFALRSTQIAEDYSALSTQGAQLQATNDALQTLTPLSTMAALTGTPLAPVAGNCNVTITNSLVPLMKEPRTFSQEVIRVPQGTYQTSDYQIEILGARTRGWFQIVAEGRTGWIKDDTWTIYAKTSACPP